MRWRDLQPGDTVIEHCGWKSVFVIARKGDLESEVWSHWDVVVLYSNHPNNPNLTTYRSNWLRAGKGSHGNDDIPPEHEVLRGGTVLFTT